MGEQEPRCYTISVQGIPPGPNARLHHLARWRFQKRFADDVAWQAASLVSTHGWHQPFDRASIVATITQRSRRYLMDHDNAMATLKALIDPLQGRLIVNDNPGHLTAIDVRQQVGKVRGVTLEITELLDGDG